MSISHLLYLLWSITAFYIVCLLLSPRLWLGIIIFWKGIYIHVNFILYLCIRSCNFIVFCCCCFYAFVCLFVFAENVRTIHQRIIIASRLHCSKLQKIPISPSVILVQHTGIRFHTNPCHTSATNLIFAVYFLWCDSEVY